MGIVAHFKTLIYAVYVKECKQPFVSFQLHVQLYSYMNNFELWTCNDSIEKFGFDLALGEGRTNKMKSNNDIQAVCLTRQKGTPL